VLVQLAMALLLILINHFPFYAIVLLLTEPGRVMGGTSFELLSRTTQNVAATVSPRSGSGATVLRATRGGDPAFNFTVVGGVAVAATPAAERDSSGTLAGSDEEAASGRSRESCGGGGVSPRVVANPARAVSVSAVRSPPNWLLAILRLVFPRTLMDDDAS